MSELTFAEILSKEDRKPVQVSIKEWNGFVFVRIMSALERAEVETIFIAIKGGAVSDTGKFRTEIIKRCLCNSSGEMLLTDNDMAMQFMSKSASAIETIFERSCELNGFREKDKETLKKK